MKLKLKKSEQEFRTAHDKNWPLPRNQSDAIKGVLILMVVIGHNLFLTTSIHQLKSVLYSFHVFCFFFLIFIRPAKSITFGEVRDLIIRYLVPFLFFSVLSHVAFFSFVSDGRTGNIWSVITDILIGSADSLKRTTGFQLYWFLPAFFSLTLVHMFISSQNRCIKYVLIALTIVLHGFIPMLPSTVKFYNLFSILCSIYVFPLGLAIGKLLEILYKNSFLQKSLTSKVLIWILTIASILYACFDERLYINLAILDLFDYASLGKMLFYDLLPILIFASLVMLAPMLSRFSQIGFLGHHSLVIYLTHQIIFRVTERVMFIAGVRLSDPINGLLTLTVSLTIAVLFSVMMQRFTSIWVLIFPRNANQWPITRKWI
jgi:fucose 4-O-acetylase-like acetyltransferase